MMMPRETQPEYLDVAEAMNGGAGALGKPMEPDVIPLEDLMLDNLYAGPGKEA